MSAFILMAIFTTSGTFMLLFLAALQNIGGEVDEAAMMDGANGWQRFWRVTLPQLRPTLFTVLTLGLIGCWQVFEQIYTGTKGGPAQDDADARVSVVSVGLPQPGLGRRARRSPSSCSRSSSLFTIFQRWVLRDRPVSKRRIRQYQVRLDAGCSDAALRPQPSRHARRRRRPRS